MKRTASKANAVEGDSDESEMKAKAAVGKNENGTTDFLQSCHKTSSEDTESIREKPGRKLNLKSLKDRNEKINEDFKPNTAPPKNKTRAVVDLKMMKEELKQLEDPPLTSWEKEICSARLPYSFFDTPCEQLAQNLLGKTLVRCLENGTILKGRIVETEGYLGAVDKASHSYQNKVTPRNVPMYMPPGTIYVYMTYGMYHCFNISSQESRAYVLVKAVEPLLGMDYIELLRNMRFKENKKEKQLVNNVRRLKTHELCNSPFKICAAFFIEQDSFDQRKIYDSNDLWIESNPRVKSTTVVAARSDTDLPRDGSAVLIRAVDPLEGIECMANARNSKGKLGVPKKSLRELKRHELCNGPSKLCMAFQLQKQYSKYSLCSWKGLWIENDTTNEDIRIVRTSRIGIDGYGPEWANKPLRYYIHGNKSVSKRDKKAESFVNTN